MPNSASPPSHNIVATAEIVGRSEAETTLPSVPGDDTNIVLAEIFPGQNENLATTCPLSWPVRLWHGVWWLLGGIFGWLSLMVGLAVVSTIPLLQFVSLGYLLECSGSIARTGKFRSGFIDLDHWARIGSLFMGSWLLLLIPRSIADLANDAYFINNGGSVAQAWRAAQFVVTLLVIAHLLSAWYCGGKLRHFFWPLLAPFSLMHWLITTKIMAPIMRPVVSMVWKNLADDLFAPQPLVSWFPPAMILAALWQGPTKMFTEARDALWDFIVRLRLPYYFWLGVRGFVGAFLWLALPLTLLAAGTKLPKDGPAVLLGLLGGLLLTIVLLYLPMLQTRFAAENRFRAMFEIGRIRELFKRAPLAFWFALFITLGLALPPYLAKVQQVFDEFHWALSLLFVVLVYPGRLLTGWAMGLALARQEPRSWVWRWGARLAAVPVCLIYVLVVYLSQFTSWFGSWSLFEQHPFMIPVPFFNG
jgi:Protein of unknown function (DUF4013)